MNVAAHTGSCAGSGPTFRYNKTNGGIYVARGEEKGRVVAVFWGDAGADGSPVTINLADKPEFAQYKNVIFDMDPLHATSVVEIKLRVNRKCLTAPAKLPGQMTLNACNSSKAQKWGMQTVGVAPAQTWALGNDLGGCAVIG